MSKNQETICEITIGGQTRVGMFPRLPVRYFLQASLRSALGLADGSEPDPFAVPMVYFAIVGLCWPTAIKPTFRDCHTTRQNMAPPSMSIWPTSTPVLISCLKWLRLPCRCWRQCLARFKSLTPP